jgi:DNA-binding NtrC family response regulator
LFYRLHVFPISIPPLRDRREDIPDLIRHFLARFCAEEGKRIHLVDTDALALLRQYRWPGNVRQLENAIFRAVVLAEGDALGAGEFPQIAAQLQSLEAAKLAPEPTGFPDEPLRFVDESPSLRPEGAAMAVGELRNALPLLDPVNEMRPLADIEADVIRFAIGHYRGRMSEIARRLGIGRSTLYRKLEGLGFDAGDDNPARNAVSDG